MYKFKLPLFLGVILVLTGVTGCVTARDTVPPTLYHLSGSTTTGPLQVRRVEITFPNERGEITVQRNYKDLKAKAIIRFNGNGPFRAAWVVDERTVEFVTVMVTFGDTLTIETAPATVLPTFEPGIHSVTLNIMDPLPPFNVPVVNYVVTVDEVQRPEEKNK